MTPLITLINTKLSLQLRAIREIRGYKSMHFELLLSNNQIPPCGRNDIYPDLSFRAVARNLIN